MDKKEITQGKNREIARNYLIAGIVTAVFGGVYEMFSHGVYSPYMMYAFMIPLVLGSLPHMIDRKGMLEAAGELFEVLLLGSVVTLTLGSIMKGVLEIYGTTNALTVAYPLLGIGLLIAALAVLLVNTALKKAAGC